MQNFSLAPPPATREGLAGVYAALGDKHEAFACLSKAYEKHDFFLVFLKVHPYMDPLRSDPRYTELLHRIGLDRRIVSAPRLAPPAPRNTIPTLAAGHAAQIASKRCLRSALQPWFGDQGSVRPALRPFHAP
jgi:hypothetical protein